MRHNAISEDEVNFQDHSIGRFWLWYWYWYGMVLYWYWYWYGIGMHIIANAYHCGMQWY